MFDAVTRFATTTLVKHGPKIGLAVGIAGMAGTAYLASRATVKIQPAYKEHRENLEMIKESRKIKLVANGKEYTEEDAKKDRVITWTNFTKDIVQHYAAPAALFGLSAACFVVSQNTLSGRLASVTAAYNGLQTLFKRYRGTIEDVLGNDKEEELFKASERGKVELDEDLNVVDIHKVEETGATQFWFNDHTAPECFEKSRSQNKFFLESKQKIWNQQLRRNGVVFLNDILHDLGMARTKEGQALGWVFDRSDKAASWIDFGIEEEAELMNSELIRMELNGDIYLNFNVHGVVWDRL